MPFYIILRVIERACKVPENNRKATGIPYKDMLLQVSGEKNFQRPDPVEETILAWRFVPDLAHDAEFLPHNRMINVWPDTVRMGWAGSSSTAIKHTSIELTHENRSKDLNQRNEPAPPQSLASQPDF